MEHEISLCLSGAVKPMNNAEMSRDSKKWLLFHQREWALNAKWRGAGGCSGKAELGAAPGAWAEGPAIPLLGSGPDSGLPVASTAALGMQTRPNC